MRNLHLLIKPASGACNLRCRYCFYADEANNRTQATMGMMSTETLEILVRRALEYADGDITFAFQGGEPTVRGLEFFRSLVEAEKKYNDRRTVIHHSIQTNGTLLDEEWAAFLKENRFLVGLSLDGTKDLHNLYRRDAEGEGTHARVLRTAALLKKPGVDYNVLTVVTAQLARHAREVFSFFLRQGMLYQQYIPCLDPLNAPRGGERFSLTPELFGRFMCDLFDCWYGEISAGRFVYIRYFENLVGMLRGFPPESCGMSGVCGVQNVVEADGTVYPCDYYVLDGYCIGDLHRNSLEEIDENRRRSGFIEASFPVHEDCLSCPYRRLCRGGCRRDRLTEENGILGKNYFCEGYRRFFSHAIPGLTRLANRPGRRM